MGRIHEDRGGKKVLRDTAIHRGSESDCFKSTFADFTGSMSYASWNKLMVLQHKVVTTGVLLSGQPGCMDLYPVFYLTVQCDRPFHGTFISQRWFFQRAAARIRLHSHSCCKELWSGRPLFLLYKTLLSI